MTNILWQV